MDGLVERLEIGQREKSAASSARPRIVIIGAGFGGLSAATRLGHIAADLTIIDRRNYHLFQPLLYQLRQRPCRPPTSPRRYAASFRGR